VSKNGVPQGSIDTGQTGRCFEKRYKEHLQSYKYNTQNSKFAQHATETGHEFGERKYGMSIQFLGKKGRYLDTIGKFYIYQQTKNNNRINDKHTVIYNKICETILENIKDS
jgi:hypothetical protein